MSRTSQSSALSQVREVKAPPKLQRILCFGAEDTSTTVLCTYLTKKALDELGIGGGVQVESIGLANLTGKPAHNFAISCLKKRDIDCSKHLSRCIHGSNSLQLIDLFLCTDVTSYQFANRLNEGSQQVVLVTGLGFLSDLTEQHKDNFDKAAEIINAFVRKFLRSYAEGCAD